VAGVSNAVSQPERIGFLGDNLGLAVCYIYDVFEVIREGIFGLFGEVFLDAKPVPGCPDGDARLVRKFHEPSGQNIAI
jgi:hypothetical protein